MSGGGGGAGAGGGGGGGAGGVVAFVIKNRPYTYIKTRPLGLLHFAPSARFIIILALKALFLSILAPFGAFKEQRCLFQRRRRFKHLL